MSFLEEEGSNPREDIPELWKRILFSCATGNTDDHMRNHGFLRERSGWRLSPVFDVNPTPGDNPKHLGSFIDFDCDDADPEVALAACEWYRVAEAEARAFVRALTSSLRHWRKVAASNGISKQSQQYMASCFEGAVEKLGGMG